MNTLLRDSRPPACTGTLSVLTFNLALLSVPLPPGIEIPISPHMRRRLEAVPAALNASGADILMLQEVFTARCRRFLIAAMRETHPHACWKRGAGSVMGNGLLILSRWPIGTPRFTPFPDKASLLQAVWQRGVLSAQLEVPSIGPLHALNVHLSPDPPFIAPDRARSRPYRVREIETLFAAAASAGDDVLLAGDFNASPEIRPDDYRLILARGLVDTFAAVHGERSIPTFDRDNRLVRAGPYRDWPSQRADHVFLNAASRWKPQRADVVFREPLSPSEGADAYPMSDHYGVLVNLSC